MLMQTLPMSPAAHSAEPEDMALVRRAARADVSAFEQLYRRHHRRVHGVIVRLVGQAGARAEDLTQEAFLRAWQALPSFRFESAVSTWLHRLAVNTALMELRARRSRPWQEDDDDALDAVATPDTVGRAVLGRDLERAVASLPPRARAVLVLHDVEGWKHEEIAGELGMAVGSSKAQLHRARGLLRARIGETA
ncbi:sigma-70 family RNA polymerase sigma factor [Thermomonas sp.]|jgi:RNA polymerase sigma-70 factor (ECF subfamily)|uniref:RNA polymerase sigma factor n=1 Tax=Thermomonas sp. TaxID=1971895 RepID=UPI002580D2BE|nr:sigma-70 family RNA polymerase sigma factor [Thermomonas sp.]